MITDDNYIEIYKLADSLGISRQNIYRWIREGKIDKNDVKIMTVKKEKMFIRKDAKIPKLTN